MSIKFNLDKKKTIRYMIMLFFATVLYRVADFPIVALVAFGIGYFLLIGCEIKFNEKLPWIWALLLFLPSAVFSMFSVQYLLLEKELFQKTTDTKLFFNVLCVLVVYFLMLFFSNHIGLSATISHIFFVVLAFVNYYVYLFRENEFIFPDLRSIGTGLSVAGNYKLELHDRGGMVILGSILFFAFARKFQVKFKKPLYMRIISILSGVLLCIILCLNTANINTETWEKKGTYRNGYILNFVLSARDSIVSEPKGYSLNLITELENTYAIKDEVAENLEKQPTVIVIMSESFADLSVLGELETNAPLTPFMDSLEENTLKGYALASVFGAKTPNSEWEYMTGGSMAFLPVGSVVYQQYIPETPTSIVSTMKNEGYTCVAMHPYYNTGWSRHLIYPTLGFDETYFIEDFDETQMIRKYISDKELYRKIIERYEMRTTEESLFFMTISMQNHGGYKQSYDNFEENYYKTGRSYSDVNQYLSLIKESDMALEYLITYFKQVEEPVEIVFFGDHHPSLNSGFYRLMNGKGLSGLTLEELQKLYTVPFFIWTNYDTPEETIEVTSLNFLSTLTLERAGIALPPYNAFLAELMEYVPAINARGYYSLEQQKYLHVEDAIGIESEWIKKYEALQYNNLFDRRNRSEVFYPYLIK